jgi:hypothetical protein
MTKLAELRHEFVDLIPEEPEAGVLYISIPYATAIHLCACGCGREVVTPLTPTDWELTFDGETVSLWPSIGNWSFGCESHYFVKRGCVSWAKKMTREQIENGRAHDRKRKERWRTLRGGDGSRAGISLQADSSIPEVVPPHRHDGGTMRSE